MLVAIEEMVRFDTICQTAGSRRFLPGLWLYLKSCANINVADFDEIFILIIHGSFV